MQAMVMMMALHQLLLFNFMTLLFTFHFHILYSPTFHLSGKQAPFSIQPCWRSHGFMVCSHLFPPAICMACCSFYAFSPLFKYTAADGGIINDL